MAEPQSRFSIIQELTNQKIAAEEKANGIKSQIETEKKVLARQIEQSKEDHELRWRQLEREMFSLEQKKEELEKGIDAIIKISEKKDA